MWWEGRRGSGGAGDDGSTGGSGRDVNDDVNGGGVCGGE